jgi:hypothetical protein
MPSVMSALKTNDSLSLFSQQINQLAFAFIAPLATDNYDIFSQVYSNLINPML